MLDVSQKLRHVADSEKFGFFNLQPSIARLTGYQDGLALAHLLSRPKFALQECSSRVKLFLSILLWFIAVAGIFLQTNRPLVSWYSGRSAGKQLPIEDQCCQVVSKGQLTEESTLTVT